MLILSRGPHLRPSLTSIAKPHRTERRSVFSWVSRVGSALREFRQDREFRAEAVIPPEELLDPSKFPSLPLEPLDRVSFLPFRLSQLRARTLIAEHCGTATPIDYELQALFVPMWLSWGLYLCDQRTTPTSSVRKIQDGVETHVQPYRDHQHAVLAFPGFPSPAAPHILPPSAVLGLPRNPIKHRQVTDPESLSDLNLPTCLAKYPFPPFVLPPPDLDSYFRPTTTYTTKWTTDWGDAVNYDEVLSSFRTPFVNHAYPVYAPVFAAFDRSSSDTSTEPFAILDACAAAGRVYSRLVPDKPHLWQSPREVMPFAQEFMQPTAGPKRPIHALWSLFDAENFWSRRSGYNSAGESGTLKYPEEINVVVARSPEDTRESNAERSLQQFRRESRVVAAGGIARELGLALGQRTDATGVDWSSVAIRNLWQHDAAGSASPTADEPNQGLKLYASTVTYIIARTGFNADPPLPEWMVEVRKARELAAAGNLQARRLRQAPAPRPPPSSSPKPKPEPQPRTAPKPKPARPFPRSPPARPTPAASRAPPSPPPLYDHEGVYALLGLEDRARARSLEDKDIDEAWQRWKPRFLEVQRAEGREKSEQLVLQVQVAMARVETAKNRATYEADGKRRAILEARTSSRR